MKKLKLERDGLNRSELKKNYSFPIYPTDSIITTKQRVVNTDNGSLRETRCTSFQMKENNSFYFDSLRGHLDKLLLQQLPKQTVFHSYIHQDINSRQCGVHCFYFLYLIKRMENKDIILKTFFEKT